MANPKQQSSNPKPNITVLPPHAADVPFSEEAEDAVIGVVLAHPEQYYSVAKIITDSKMFFLMRNEVIWRSMTALINQSMAIDSITLTDYLSKKESDMFVTLEPYHFTMLAANAPSAHNVEVYAELVKRASIRRQIIINSDEIRRAAMDESLPTESLEPLLAQNQLIYAELATEKMQHISGPANDHMDMFEEAIRNKGKTSIQTGLTDLDYLLTGLHDRKFIVVGGLSHHGKTAMLLEIALNSAEQGFKVSLCNVADGDDVDVMNRLATMMSGVPTRKFIMGTSSPDEQRRYVDAMGKINQLPIYIKSQKGMSPGEIEIECKTLKNKQGNPIIPDIIIIDYIQRMYLKDNPPPTRREELMKISQGLTKLGDAKHFNCPIVAGAQLRMSGRHTDRPSGADVQESKDIFQDCDVFISVYRDALVNDKCEFPNEVELIVDKNKQTGQVGVVSCYFDSQSARIVNGVRNKVHLGSTR
jgi:replicative DNA helicase